MPHDAKGRELKAGDTILVPFKVKAVHQTEDACNLDLETCATMPPEHKWQPGLSAINSRMTLRANRGDDTSFAVLHKGMGELHIVAVAPEDDPEPQLACDVPLGRRGARDGA